MRIYLIYDSGNPEQNMEQVEGFMSEQAARARCEALNELDYSELGTDDFEDCWRWTYVDVVEES